MNDLLSLIGTPRYPLRRPKEQYTWNSLEGARITDSVLCDVLRAAHKRRPFKSGQCYGNTETVVSNAEAYGYPVRSFVGWILIHDVPIHHCWATLHVSGSRWPLRIIDLSTLFLAQDLTDEFWKAGGWEDRKARAETGNWEEFIEYAVGWRKAYLEMLRPYEQGDIIENRIFGIVPKGATYIGCPCSPQEGRREYEQWHAKYGTSLDTPGLSSLTQEIEAAISSGVGVEAITNRLKKAGAYQKDPVSE